MTTHLSRLRFLSCPSKSCAGPDGVERGTGYDAGSAMQASAMPETGSAALLLAMRPASRRTSCSLAGRRNVTAGRLRRDGSPARAVGEAAHENRHSEIRVAAWFGEMLWSTGSFVSVK